MSLPFSLRELGTVLSDEPYPKKLRCPNCVKTIFAYKFNDGAVLVHEGVALSLYLSRADMNSRNHISTLEQWLYAIC